MGAKVTHYKIREEVHWIPDETLAWSRKCLYGRLVLRCNHKNESWWSNEKLAREMQIGKRTLQKWCRELENLGLIKVDRSRSKRRTNSIAITEPTFDEWLELGVPRDVLERLRGEQPDTPPVSSGTPRGEQPDTPIIKEKGKTKMKTGGRVTVDSLWGDDDVQASGKRAVEASRKREGRAIHTATSLPAPEESSLPDEGRLGRWANKDWSDAFVTEMNRAGFGVAFQKYKTVQAHVGAIKDHLINRGFSRVKIHRFLLEWFPNAYPGIRSSVFKKGSEDRMFSVSWMEPRLDELVRLFENKDESSWDSKVTVME